MRIRTFIAVSFSVAVTRRIADEVEKRRAEIDRAWRVAWVAPASYHLTLRFLGGIEEALLEGIAGRLARIRCAPFEMRARGLGAFPSPERPSVLWVGVSGGDALVALQREVEQAVVGLGLPREERPFRPHLTVGRVKEPRGGDAQPALWTGDVDCGASTVTELIVYESKTLAQGAEHIARARVPLNKET